MQRTVRQQTTSPLRCTHCGAQVKPLQTRCPKCAAGLGGYSPLGYRNQRNYQPVESPRRSRPATHQPFVLPVLSIVAIVAVAAVVISAITGNPITTPGKREAAGSWQDVKATYDSGQAGNLGGKQVTSWTGTVLDFSAAGDALIDVDGDGSSDVVVPHGSKDMNSVYSGAPVVLTGSITNVSDSSGQLEVYIYTSSIRVLH